MHADKGQGKFPEVVPRQSGHAPDSARCSEVPVLALGGTLDGRTDIDSQREAVSRLGSATFVTVHNAGHNLFDERSDDIQAAIDAFLEGKRVQDSSITVELPDMKPALVAASQVVPRSYHFERQRGKTAWTMRPSSSSLCEQVMRTGAETVFLVSEPHLDRSGL